MKGFIESQPLYKVSREKKFQHNIKCFCVDKHFIGENTISIVGRDNYSYHHNSEIFTRVKGQIQD